jgi:hypothetical protein
MAQSPWMKILRETSAQLCTVNTVETKHLHSEMLFSTIIPETELSDQQDSQWGGPRLIHAAGILGVRPYGATSFSRFLPYSSHPSFASSGLTGQHLSS